MTSSKNIFLKSILKDEKFILKNQKYPLNHRDSGISFTSFTSGSLYYVMQSTDSSFSFFLFQTRVRKLLLPSGTLPYLMQTLGYSSFGQGNCTAEVTHWLYFPLTMGLVLGLAGVKGGGCCCPMANAEQEGNL